MSHLALNAGRGALFLLILSTGCSVGPLLPVEEEWVRVAADEAYLSGRHAESLSGYEKLANQAHSESERNRANLQKALCLIELGQIPEAEKTLRSLRKATGPTDPLAGRIALALAEIHQVRDEFEPALQEYERSLETGEVPSDAILMRSARIARRGGHWNAARQLLQQFILLHPSSAHRKLAIHLLGEPFYSIQVGVFQNHEHAKKLSRKLSKARLDVRITQIPTDTESRHHVRIGRYGSREEAEKTRQRLVANRHLTHDAFVVP